MSATFLFALLRISQIAKTARDARATPIQSPKR